MRKVTGLVLGFSVVVLSGCMSATTGDSQAKYKLQKESARALVKQSTLQSHKRRHSMKIAPEADVAAYAAGMQPGLLVAPAPVKDLEKYAEIDSNKIARVAEQPVSTFSIDVDTAAYANVRRMLQEGRMPRRDAVRIEEMINYFSYDDVSSDDRSQPFAVNMQMAPTPWNGQTQILRIGLKAWQKTQAELPPANLVFLVDVSGSMHSENKLPLLKRSLKLLTRQMREEDKVTLVVYAGASGVALEPTPGNQAAKIEQALDQLSAGGSTNGGAGIHLAYAKARESFVVGGINRVIIATDGDFNVGTVNQRALIELIERKARQGIALTTLGFGRGNYNDHLMEQLADKGNGNHAYIDSLLEANKVLVEQMGGTLLTVAKDVKVQVEFNPARVRDYRLIGYENRLLAREDFNNDQVDAGEIGAGHSVVALYEVTLQETPEADPLRYASLLARPSSDTSNEYAYVKLRYKAPNATQSQLLSFALTEQQRVEMINKASDDLRFATAVAAFGQRLHGGKYLKGYDYAKIRDLANTARGKDEQGYRAEFLRLVSLAKSLDVKPIVTADLNE